MGRSISSVVKPTSDDDDDMFIFKLKMCRFVKEILGSSF